ncbi:hypothetical protein BC832DRAFT_595531 [Gaertneriomyces semiglobifer]|nr:hypothetical protein BC832DRAFT_595531 [Gaertneriomyces semiglobifer]
MLINCRGERTNQQRRQQFNEGRALSDRRGLNGWKHDAIIDIQLESQWWHLYFLEVVGSPTLINEQKYSEDLTKTFKAMQLAVFNIRNLLLCRGVTEDKLGVVEAHGCIVYQRKLEHFRMVRDQDGLYLVDVIFEASLPDRKDEMAGQFPDILEYNLLRAQEPNDRYAPESGCSVAKRQTQRQGSEASPIERGTKHPGYTIEKALGAEAGGVGCFRVQLAAPPAGKRRDVFK